MSERATFDAYAAHASGCGSCHPGSGLLCVEGRRLHDAWQAEALKLPPKTIDDTVARVLGRDPFTGKQPRKRRSRS